MALILKQELEKNEKYHQCCQEIQQTELLFLMPLCQRTKACYFNLDSLMNWADKVLRYKEKQDFSLIDKRPEIDRVAKCRFAVYSG